MLSILAKSISRSVRRALSAELIPLRVLAVFEHAWDLITPDGRVMTLVTPHVGNGPLNIVIDASLGGLPQPAIGGPATIDAQHLRLGDIEITLACPEWDPRPDWAALRGRLPLISAQGPALARLAREIAPSPGLLQLTKPTTWFLPGIADAFANAEADLPVGELWRPERVARAAARVAGVGVGLTPSGDDWLAGLLMWIWLAHPRPEELGAAVMGAAASRTTILSAALLRCAADGECDEAWHGLLHALAFEQQTDVEADVRRILNHGATSGADMLAGFLYPMGQARD